MNQALFKNCQQTTCALVRGTTRNNRDHWQLDYGQSAPQSKKPQTKTLWAYISGKSPMELGIPPLKIKTTLAWNPDSRFVDWQWSNTLRIPPTLATARLFCLVESNHHEPVSKSNHAPARRCRLRIWGPRGHDAAWCDTLHCSMSPSVAWRQLTWHDIIPHHTIAEQHAGACYSMS